LPWYFSWPLALGLLAGWETVTGRASLLFSLTAPAVMHFSAIWGGVPAGTLNLLYLAPLALPLVPRLLAQSPSPQAAAVLVPDHGRVAGAGSSEVRAA
jgi:hypothetical protein